MGRKLMRVPLDFCWPQGQTWKGYLNPYHSMPCKSCDGSGLNPATKKLSDEWYRHLRSDGADGWGHHLEQADVQALVDANRLWDFTRTPRTPEQAVGVNGWLPENNGYIPTAAEVNEWSRKGMGHDSINRCICVEARAKRMGIYGNCHYCGGEGVLWQSDEIKELAEKWKPFDPPIGEGFQLWETTSEGSPTSPIFETIEALCAWCETNATTFANFKATAQEWREMLNHDFVCHKSGNNVFI